MTTILALSDTHLNKDGKLHLELKKLAATADLVLHAGDFISQETYDALKKACKGELRAVHGVYDKGLKDSNGNNLNSEEVFSPSTYIEFIGNEVKHNIRIYLVNDPIGTGKEFPEKEVMDKAAAKDVDLLVYGVNYQPSIVWGKDGNAEYRMLVCPGSSSPFYHSSHSAVLLDVNEGKISRAKVVRIPITYQVGWRRCKNCESLFWGPGADKSKCPKGGTHAIHGTNQYCLAHNDPNAFGQAKWRWCKSCQSLFFAPKSKDSICPATNKDTHKTFSGSGDYTIIRNYPNDDPKTTGEDGWRLCKYCYGLFFAGTGTSSGVCLNNTKGNKKHESTSDKYRVEVGLQ